MARQATARFTGWVRAALPDVVDDAPAAARGRRDRIADAAAYLFAFTVATATLTDAWEQHPAWLRPVAIVVGIAALVSLRWRRTHPAAVGIGIGTVALVILTASGANLVATFNAAVRAGGRDLAIIAGLAIGWPLVNPVLSPPDTSYAFDAGAGLLMAGTAIGW